MNTKNKKFYCFFSICDKYHVKLNATYCVYGNEHQLARFQYLAMNRIAKMWGREFNPIHEFMPYDWNANTVYIGGEIKYNEPAYFYKNQTWLNLDEIL